MLRFSIKLGIAGGTLYYIADQGVWKSSEDTKRLCNKICTNLSPYTNELKKQIPYELPSLPPTNEISFLANYYWNKGVLNTFNFLANLPDNISIWTNDGLNIILDNTELKELFVSTAENAAEANQAIK